MAGYHVVLVHFPTALWMTAALAIIYRALFDGPVAQAIDKALVPLLSIALVFGVSAYAVGLFVWPFEAISGSPLGRNHMLLATWTTAYWALLLVLRWRRGQAIWQGTMRFVTAGLAVIGAVLLGITGTLGGHLIGVYTDVSQVLRKMGWEVYTTFYVPNLTLAALGAIALVLVVIGYRARAVRA
ncbi:hypothetical protein IP69_17245 [Bosea sp. AAP35]|uniref:hypothetical protein n=1 Tax=Bosea sp. AAP35 TaxID=1523417 RepID=UPI0006B8C5DA|nr:hypothetical protein [Bosea sp. AAP35]KPF65687.1 hypothetical protein IP69_17245 [Bosea sp. AAP35]